MNEIKLYKSPWKAIRLFALMIPFVAIGIWMIINSGSDLRGWFVTCFFGLGILVGLFHLFDRRPQIVINAIGIWDRTTKQDLIKWELIKNAYPIDIYGQKFISLKLEKSFEIQVKQYRWATWLSKVIGGQKINLHLGQINIDANKFSGFIKEMMKSNLEKRKELVKKFSNMG